MWTLSENCFILNLPENVFCVALNLALFMGYYCFNWASVANVTFVQSEPMVATLRFFAAVVTAFAATSRIGFILQSSETIKSR